MTRTTSDIFHQRDGRVLVAGLGKSGLSVARFLARRDIPFAVADSREVPPGLEELRSLTPDAIVHCGDFDPALFASQAFIVLSPGIATDIPALVAARAAGAVVMGDIELFALSADAPVVAITGSNGKSTTTTLVGEMAAAAGLDVRVGGNLGTPALDLSGGQAPDLYVLELSSFQLETTSSLHCTAATVLNISDDHLDRHHTLLEYAAIKQRIFTGDGPTVLNADDALVSAMADARRKVVWFGLGEPRDATAYGVLCRDGHEWIARGDDLLMRAEEVRMPGRHNLANALAALALGEAAGLAREPMLAALRTFSGLPHRCEFVAEHDGVRYYNDSKGTNVGSTLAALAGMPGKKVVLIAGGEGKGQDFLPLASGAAARARAVVLIGRDAPILADALQGHAPILFASSMQDAVEQARASAVTGDSVLLSPACASFDMFKNYVHRGEVFTAAVKGLAS